MSACCRIQPEAGKTQEHREAANDTDQWQRWDEELVEELGRWLSRLAKAFAIMLLAVFAAIGIGWLWKAF